MKGINLVSHPTQNNPGPKRNGKSKPATPGHAPTPHVVQPGK